MAAATDGLAGSIQVAQAWSRPTPPVGATGAAYLTITNSGSKPDRLLGASTPTAVSAEINETRHSQGVAQMRRLESLEIPPGQTVMVPGALHIMLLDLVRPLKPGAQYPLTLNFRDAGAVTVQVQVREQP
jgi:periplasmic copper chaperone A